MPGYPATSEDTVLYGKRNIYGDKDITVQMLDGADLSIWGEVFVNGSPLSGGLIDVRTYGAVGDGVTDDTAAINAAIAAAPAYGGTVFLPTGFYKTTSTINIDGKRINLVGVGVQQSYIYYYGSGTAIDLQEPNSSIQNMAIVNSGGTGLKGIIVGKQLNTTAGIYQVINVFIHNFLTAGLHLTNSELGYFRNVTVNGGNVCATGFLIDASRNSAGGASGMNNVFHQCRGYSNTGAGWDMNNQIGLGLYECESWSNAGLYQAYLRGSTWCANIRAFDLEDVPGNGTSSGLYMGGESHSVTITGYKLNKGIELVSATGCFIGPSRFSSVTQTILVGSTCLSNTIFDTGLLGSIGEAAPKDTQFIGRRGRNRFYEIRGDVNGGFLEFSYEQSSAPAGAADKGRLFIKDNGSGKTQLCVVFGTGAVQVIATEP